MLVVPPKFDPPKLPPTNPAAVQWLCVLDHHPDPDEPLVLEADAVEVVPDVVPDVVPGVVVGA